MKLTLIPAAACGLLLVSCQKGFHDDSGRTAATSSRTYAVEVERAWQSLQGVMKDLDLDVDTAEHDALGGEMTAKRATGDLVYVRVRSLAPSSTSIDVAADTGDRVVAQMIQDRVSAKLGGDSPGGVGATVGSVVEGVYPNALDECVAAAERALKALNLPVESREKHDIWSTLRSRHLDTIPVSVKLVRTAQDQTQATFTVGTAPGDDNQLLSARLKKEFEAALGAPARP